MKKGEAGRTRLLMVRSGGWDQWVETLADHLGRHGFVVSVLVPNATVEQHRTSGAFSIQGGVRSRGLTGVWRSALALRRHLARADPDILYVVDSWSIPMVWLATAGKLRWPRTSVVYHTFEWIEPAVHGRARCHLEKLMCRRADLVVNVDRTRGRVQQLVYGLARTPLWVRNSLSRDYPVPVPSSEARRRLLGQHPPEDSVAVVCPSSMHPDRRGVEIVRAVAKLPPRFRLAAIAGSGPYQDECARVAEASGASDRVTFLPRMSFHEAMTCAANADIGLVLHDGKSPSLGNYLANPMRLSMFAASGIPVVATDLPSVAEEVYRHGLGVCCDSSEPGSIAAAIERLERSALLKKPRNETIVAAFREETCFERRAADLEHALLSLEAGVRHE